MNVSRLDDDYAAELLQRQAALQAEAGQVIAALDVPAHLSRAGRVEQIGSSVSGLMVWRDLDFAVTGPGMTAVRAFEAIQPIATQPQTVALTYENKCGARSPTEGGADDCYYFVVRYETPTGDIWNIDIAFWALDAPRRQMTHVEELRRRLTDPVQSGRLHVEELPRRLTDQTRLIILWLKDVWHRLPTYPYEVGGTDVYDAVLEHDVRTPDQFDAYLRARGLPARP
jgi:hypothetical protein